jgi:predicted component of type VI protein secretion system
VHGDGPPRERLRTGRIGTEHNLHVPGRMTLRAVNKSEPDHPHVGSLLADLIAKLDTLPRRETLTPLVSACDAAIVAALEVLRERPGEPAPPTRSELASLRERLLTANCRDAIGVLEQLRGALGRLDAAVG